MHESARCWWRAAGWAIVGLMLAGCRTGPSLMGGRPAPLRIGVTPDSPPIIFKQGNDIRGIEADLARELARAMGRPLQFVELPWELQITALLDGKTDLIMSGMTITDERRVRIAFSDPYLLQGQSALIRRADLARFGAAKDLLTANAHFAVQKKTTGDMLAQQVCRNAASVGWLNPDEGAQALCARMVDIYIHDTPIVIWLASENEAELTAVPLPTPRQEMAAGAKKTDAALLAEVNRLLAEWKTNGTLDRIRNSWLPPSSEP